MLQVETEGGAFFRQMVDAAGGEGGWIFILHADGRYCRWRWRMESFAD